jgi:hypothetical protein
MDIANRKLNFSFEENGRKLESAWRRKEPKDEVRVRRALFKERTPWQESQSGLPCGTTFYRCQQGSYVVGTVHCTGKRSQASSERRNRISRVTGRANLNHRSWKIVT